MSHNKTKALCLQRLLGMPLRKHQLLKIGKFRLAVFRAPAKLHANRGDKQTSFAEQTMPEIEKDTEQLEGKSHAQIRLQQLYMGKTEFSFPEGIQTKKKRNRKKKLKSNRFLVSSSQYTSAFCNTSHSWISLIFSWDVFFRRSGSNYRSNYWLLFKTGDVGERGSVKKQAHSSMLKMLGENSTLNLEEQKIYTSTQ